MIVIVNYGLGNLGSVLNMLKKIGANAIISGNKSDILEAEKLILPGVGSFDSGMSNLNELDLVSVLNQKVLEEKTPVLGICLGMQLLSKSSEEGKLPGLGWIDAETVRFNLNNTSENLKIPHMGWNMLEVRQKNFIFSDMYDEPRFYFVHSYHVACKNKENVMATTHYGIDFTSAVCNGNIFGTQFHPEKSHKFGLKLLKNFVEMSI